MTFRLSALNLLPTSITVTCEIRIRGSRAGSRISTSCSAAAQSGGLAPEARSRRGAPDRGVPAARAFCRKARSARDVVAARGRRNCAPTRMASKPPNSDRGIQLPPAPPGCGNTIRRLTARSLRNLCGSIGFDFAHVDDPAARQWLQDTAERGEPLDRRCNARAAPPSASSRQTNSSNS